MSIEQKQTDMYTVGAPYPTNVVEGTEIKAAPFYQIMDVLQELINHTHIVYDDYATACNCNCNCNCTRGIL